MVRMSRCQWMLRALPPGMVAFFFAFISAPSTQAQLTARISAGAQGIPSYGIAVPYYQAFSGDGRWLTFWATGPGWGNVYVRDVTSGRLIVASVTLPGASPFGGGQNASISRDGRYVAFESISDELVPSDTNSASDIFVFDRASHVVHRVSVDSFGNQGHGHSTFSMISGDGSTVAFLSSSTDLVPNDTNLFTDVFVHDLASGATTRATVDSNGQEGHCLHVLCEQGYLGLALSYDGNVVAFGSWMTNLVSGDTNIWPDVFVRDRAAGTTERVSVSSTGAQGDDFSQNASVSCDGRFVAFDSWSTNLVPGDTNGVLDVFVRDRWTGTTERVSVDSSGNQSHGGGLPAISCNGRLVAFFSNASDLVPNDTNGVDDVFVHDRLTGTTTRVTLGLGGQQVYPGGYSQFLSVTDDGKVVFASDDASFALGDNNSSFDVFLHDPALPSNAIAGYCTPKTNSLGCAPRITTTGFPSLTDPATFFVTTQSVRSRQSGMLIWSLSPQALPFAGAWRCVAPPIHRTALQSAGGSSSPDCSGTYSFHFSPNYLDAHGLSAGTVVYGQFYGRDEGFSAPNNVGLTDAVRFTVLP
jgi:Tol biopolymer transport system component